MSRLADAFRALLRDEHPFPPMDPAVEPPPGLDQPERRERYLVLCLIPLILGGLVVLRWLYWTP